MFGIRIYDFQKRAVSRPINLSAVKPIRKTIGMSCYPQDKPRARLSKSVQLEILKKKRKDDFAFRKGGSFFSPIINDSTGTRKE